MAADNLGREMPANNQVAGDLIWKGHCESEIRSKNNFQAKWGYLKGPMEQFVEDQMDELVDKERPNWRQLIEKPVEEPEPTSNYIHIQPSPKPVPQTTSGMIGWRSNDSKNWLDRYGPPYKPKPNIFNQLKWPENVAL